MSLNVWIKLLRSFMKREWNLDDYPVRMRHHEVGAQPYGRLRPIPWVAVIEEWLLSGHGSTREEALADLQRAFDRYKTTGQRLPRPGTHVPLQFASTNRMDVLGDIARDFFPKVLQLDYDDCLVTDESSLWDFHADKTNDLYSARIREHYGVDVSDLRDARLCDILERLENQRRSA